MKSPVFIPLLMLPAPFLLGVFVEMAWSPSAWSGAARLAIGLLQIVFFLVFLMTLVLNNVMTEGAQHE